MKRVFIALKTTPDLENKILSWRENKLNWPVRFIKPKNLHLTLAPPWNCLDISLLIDKLSKIKIEDKSINLNFKLIDYGPNSNNYRLIWVLGEYSVQLENLKNKIEDSLGFSKPRRKFLPHLSLARFKEIPPINVKEAVNWKEVQSSFVLFESVLKKEGAEYNILKRFNF